MVPPGDFEFGGEFSLVLFSSAVGEGRDVDGPPARHRAFGPGRRTPGPQRAGRMVRRITQNPPAGKIPGGIDARTAAGWRAETASARSGGGLRASARIERSGASGSCVGIVPPFRIDGADPA